MQRIRKGDKVVVITGKNKGGSGIVLKVLTKQNKAIVEGINKVTVYKKEQVNKRSKQTNPTTKEAPLPLNKLALFDQKAKQQTIGKIKYQIDPKTKQKTRVFKKTNNAI